MMNQNPPLKDLVNALIRNNYDRVKTSAELNVDINIFKSEEYINYVTNYKNVNLSKSDLIQIIIYELNHLDRQDPFYSKTKQKYLDQLIQLCNTNIENTTNTDYVFEI